MSELKEYKVEVRFVNFVDFSSDVVDVWENFWICFMIVLYWYLCDMLFVEKWLVFKLDLMIFIYGCFMFFMKYLD